MVQNLVSSDPATSRIVICMYHFVTLADDTACTATKISNVITLPNVHVSRYALSRTGKTVISYGQDHLASPPAPITLVSAKYHVAGRFVVLRWLQSIPGP